MSRLISHLCKTRGSAADVGCDQDGEDCVDPSPRDHQITTCAKEGISGDNPKAYLAPRGDTGIAYLHQREDRAIFIRRP